MSLPESSVRRPVTVFVAALALMIFGYLSFTNIPVELMPDLSYPTLTVQTEYPDAAPTSVEQFVTRPLEEGLGVLSGVREMRSVSRAGLSEIVLEYGWDERMDFAAMEAREKIGLVRLPDEAERPRVLRFDPTLDPIVRLAFTGDRPLDELRQIADRWLKPRLEAIQGVAAAKVRGGLDPEVQVEADEDRLAALGLTLDDLAAALRQENVNRPGGTIKDWGAVYLVRTLHEFTDLDQLRQTVVRERASGRVRVEDVARVSRGHHDRQEITRSAGAETVEIALHREGSTNTLVVARAIHEALDGPPGQPELGLRRQLADDLQLRVLTDQSVYIADAIGQVRSAALIGGLLAVLVLYFFLRDAWSTVIIGLTIPISVVVTFLPLYKTSVTLNIMSLGGLALGVGMLVDNSIVVLESIDRRRREGLAAAQAAAQGARDVAGAVSASTLTTVSVFLPIVFVRGVAGQLFYDLSVTVCLALLTSLAVSLTLIPMLSALRLGELRRISVEAAFGGTAEESAGRTLLRLLRWDHLRASFIGRSPRWWVRGLLLLSWPVRQLVLAIVYVLRVVLFCVLWGLRSLLRGVLGSLLFVLRLAARLADVVFWPLSRVTEGLGRAYPGALKTALRARRAVLPLAFAVFVMAIALLPLLGTNLVPDLAQGEFAFRLRLPEGTTLESSSEIVERVERRCLGDAEFERVFSVVGSWPSTASGQQTVGENLAQINFVLSGDAGAEREASAIARVRQILDVFPNLEAELARPSVLSVSPPLAVDLFSENLDDLDRAAGAAAQMLATIPGARDIATSSEPGNPEVKVELDRDRAAALGVRAEPLSRSMRLQIGGEIVGQFREEEQRLDIRVRASEDWRNRASEIGALRYRLDNGTVVPVSAFAAATVGRGPAAIHRVDGGRVARVTAKVASADLGAAVAQLRKSLHALHLPASVNAELAGQDEELRVSFDSLRLALALAVFMVYVVMAVQFESLRHPFVILLSVPLGIVGVVLALLVTGTTVSVLALIGAVMLAGIVVNNAIVLVDAVNRRRARGEPIDEAIVGAGQERLRPILMTTATTVLALLPMALGIGAGNELRQPLAVTVIGGLTVATLLTLVVIPCLYRAMDGGAAGTATEKAAAPLLADGAAEEARS